MAGGPILPSSTKPDTPDRVFPAYGGSGPDSLGLGVQASVGADSTWKCRFRMPPTLPTGTAKLQLDVMSAKNVASNNVARVNVHWASVAVDGSQDPDGFTLFAEGAQSVTWAAGEGNKLKRTSITLDADAGGIVAGEWVVMDLIFETTSWTLDEISVWYPAIIWE